MPITRGIAKWLTWSASWDIHLRDNHLGGSGGNCVEIAVRPEAISVRVSKDLRVAPLALTPTAWATFTAATMTSVRYGESVSVSSRRQWSVSERTLDSSAGLIP